jgi:uncharacterized repeat protein (TIGR02543 family)
LTTDIPNRDGYTFEGWSTRNNATTPDYYPGGSYSGNADITWYAVWKVNEYTVSYDANGGDGEPASQIKYFDVPLTLSETIPTREGYRFAGWSASSNSTGIGYRAGDTYYVNSSVILYAVWKANEYTVSYNANGGSGAPASQIK